MLANIKNTNMFSIAIIVGLLNGSLFGYKKPKKILLKSGDISYIIPKVESIRYELINCIKGLLTLVSTLQKHVLVFIWSHTYFDCE